MKQISAFSLFGLILLLAIFVSFNTQTASGVSVGLETVSRVQSDEPAAADEAIEEAMEAMKSAGRSIRRSLRKKDVTTALTVVNRAQLTVIEAKKLVPSAASKLEGEAKVALARDYRQRLIAVLEQWILVEKALLQGNAEEASKLMKTISDLKKSGHKKFEVGD